MYQSLESNGASVSEYGCALMLQSAWCEVRKSPLREARTEDKTVRTPAVSHVPRKDTRAGRDHGFEKTTLKDSNSLQGGDGTAPRTPLSEDLREKGKLKEWVGKIGGTEASLGSQDKVQIIDQAEPLVGMQ
nr:hypothetical protein CFP56_53455 [Quercus suber]